MLLPFPSYFKSKKETRASFLSRLISLNAGNNPKNVRADTRDYLTMLYKHGDVVLVNHLFDELYKRARVSRQCLPTKLRKRLGILAELHKFLPELPLAEVPGNEGAKFDPMDVILHINTTATLDIDLELLSKVDPISTLAIMTGCLSAGLEKVCSHKCVRTAGLFMADQFQNVNSPPPYKSPPPYMSPPPMPSPFMKHPYHQPAPLNCPSANSPPKSISQQLLPKKTGGPQPVKFLMRPNDDDDDDDDENKQG